MKLKGLFRTMVAERLPGRGAAFFIPSFPRATWSPGGSFAGTGQSLSEALTNIIRECGGEVRLKEKVEKYPGRRPAGGRVRKRQGRLSCQGVYLDAAQ